MNDEQYLLANAFLDGELTAEERRIAEADPEVMTEVERLRALQAELRDVPAPTAAAREAAISAAMAAFDSSVADEVSHGVTDEPSGAPVVPFRPRPAYAKYLGVAAAFVAVAGLGIILARAGQGGDDDSSDAATAVLDSAAVARDGEALESEPADGDVMSAADDAGGANAGDESEAAAVEDEVPAEESVGGADEDTGDATTEDTAEASAEPTAYEPTGDTAESGGGPYREVPPDFDPEAPIANEVELGVYGAYLIAERDAGNLPPTPNHACDDAEQVLDEATLRLGDELVPVYVDVRETVGVAAALHRDTCAELMLGSLHAD
jgi:hypothetical protein